MINGTKRKSRTFPPTPKICRQCNSIKNPSEYNKQPGTGDGLQTMCRDCVTAKRRSARAEIDSKRRAWREANPEKAREQWQRTYRRSRLKQYGITEEIYAEIKSRQNNSCGICTSPTNGNQNADFHIDHDHATGTVRGLLCFRCNAAIGLFMDDPNLLAKAIEYLTEKR